MARDFYNLEAETFLHKVRITSEGTGSLKGKVGSSIEAYLPQDISFNTEGSWEAPFQGLVNSSGLAVLTSLGGFSLKSQALSQQVWMGVEPLQFTLKLQFIARTDARKEVLDPIQKLLEMVSPSTNGATFVPPGPSYASTLRRLSDDLNKAGAADSAGGSEIIGFLKSSTAGISGWAADHVSQDGEEFQVQIGNILRITNIVLQGVRPTLLTQQLLRGKTLETSGLPMRTEADVTFRTITSLTKENIRTIFQPLPQVTSRTG